MKKLLLLILVVFAGYMASQAQGLRLNGYINYTFDDKFDTFYSSTSYFDGVIKGSMQWGAGLEYLVAPEYGIEVVYYRQDTKVPINYWNQVDIDRELELGVNYIMHGGMRYMAANPKVEGYGGLMLGMAIFDNKMPLPGEPDSATKFAWGARLGANIWASEKVGLKLQAHLLSAVQSVGGSFYFGTGGSGAGVSTYSTVLQFSLGGGLVFKLRGEE